MRPQRAEALQHAPERRQAPHREVVRHGVERRLGPQRAPQQAHRAGQVGAHDAAVVVGDEERGLPRDVLDALDLEPQIATRHPLERRQQRRDERGIAAVEPARIQRSAVRECLAKCARDPGEVEFLCSGVCGHSATLRR
jgi:hypothetical protein